jgi:cell division protein FtsI (penicillin-binding protein 3)
LKSRIVILFAGLTLLWGVLILRAVVLQVLPNERLEALQTRQFKTVITLQSRRGVITDRHGRELALSTKAYSLYADPKLIENKVGAARRLAKVFGPSSKYFFAKIKDGKKRFIWLERLFNEEKASEIRSWDIKGLQVVEEYKRVYPNEELLAPVLGFVGKDGKGLEGLELEQNSALEGNTKRITVRRDARGRPLVADGLMFAENPDGAEIKLTVDSEIQHALETELRQATHEFEADRATGVILDAKTSAIIAMASAPTFDANRALSMKPGQRRNRPITDAFEPGSTLKTFVIAAGLKEKIIQPNTRYNTEYGKFKVGDRIIKESEAKERWSSLTVSEILQYSSNVGTTKIAFDLGPVVLEKALHEFGFGAKTGVDLPGDAKGIMNPLPWRPHLLANISFGQGIGVTALQLANAYAAIANGGVLNTPYMVQSIRDPDTNELTEYKPKIIRRVLKPEDAASVNLMLMGATGAGGTGENARVDGFPVAGKTGTAQKARVDGLGYEGGGYISSFAGFMPANDPKFVILILVDNPKKKNSYYGSQVAAPIFSRIASYAARREGLAPVLLSEKNFPQKPSAKTLREEKKIRAQVIKTDYESSLQSATIPSVITISSTALMPAAVVLAPQNFLATSEAVAVPTNPNRAVAAIEAALTGKDEPEQSSALPQEVEGERVPDFMKLSMREVLKHQAAKDLEIRFRGRGGVVAEMVPSPGEPLPKNKRITLYMKSTDNL